MWLKVCATALVALVVLRSSMLFWKKISSISPPTPARIWMIVVRKPVTTGTPRHSMLGRIAAGRTSITNGMMPSSR